MPLPLCVRQGGKHGVFQRGEVVRREVGQVAVLGVAPDMLHGVEGGSVGREPFDYDPPAQGQSRCCSWRTASAAGPPCPPSV